MGFFFLIDRWVKLKSSLIDEVPTPDGLPQGSGARNIRYLVMLNHLPGVISQFSLLFTANTPFRGNTCQRADILADLLTVNEWAQMDGMIHNLTKSQHLRIEAPPPILLPIPDWSRPSIPFHRLARQKKPWNQDLINHTGRCGCRQGS